MSCKATINAELVQMKYIQYKSILFLNALFQSLNFFAKQCAQYCILWCVLLETNTFLD